MKFKSLFNLLLFIYLVHFTADSVAQTPERLKRRSKSIQLLNSQDRTLTIELKVPEWFSEKVEVNGEDLTRIDFEGAVFMDQAGIPQIPYYVFVIGIPIGAHVRHQILDSEYDVENGVKLLPFSRIRKVEGWPEKEYVLNKSAYESPGTYPSSVVKIDEPAFFRDQQIVRIQVAAVQYLPVKNQIVKNNRIVLQLDFLGGQRSNQHGLTIQSNLDESFYQKALINYNQALKWRKTKTDKRKLAKTRSLFATNSFYKFTIQEEGIYKIDGAFLASKGVNLDAIVPEKIRIYNNGGKELPRDMNAMRPEGLIENAVIVVDGGDGRFDNNDYILFYGRGVEGWEYNADSNAYSHYINHYEFINVYWLSFDSQQDGKRMSEVSSGSSTGNIINVYQGMTFLEEELDNPLRSGLNFFGRQFASDVVSRNKSFDLQLPNALPEMNTQLKIRFATMSTKPDKENPLPPILHSFEISISGTIIDTVEIKGDLSDYTIMRSPVFAIEKSNVLRSGENKLAISYRPSRSNGVAYLDWFEIFYTARMQALNDELAFTVFPASGLQTYKIDNFSNNSVELYDVTDFENVKQIVNFDFSNGSLTFTDFQQPGYPRRYIALTSDKYKSIDNLENVAVSDLRSTNLGAEFIILTHEDFYSQALLLESLRENGSPDNRLITEIVRISDVYNNFSGGLTDPTAIRDFLKYAYENWSPVPAYVLLLGDGDYDPKNIVLGSDKNWIPTFQTDELGTSRLSSPVLQELKSRTTDSWFTYISGNDNVMDMAIGRLTAQSVVDAENAVNKIINYETNPYRGIWRNTVTIVGDDELVANGRPSAGDVVHITQAENIAENSIPACFDVEKIYLSEFPKILSASVSGVRKPAAQEQLIRQMNKGTLIVNFIGHGNSRLWAHEIVFEKADNDRVLNEDKLIFFVAATCDWALFDNPQEQSQAEELLLVENRGAIAILSSARLVFSNSNFRFNKFFYANLFNTSGATNRIGDAFITARMLTNQIENDEKFHIYGDPTLRLAVPKQKAVITSMIPDSIVALTTVEVTGEVRIDKQIMDDFTGKAMITTFDSKKFVQHLPEAGSFQRYFLPGNSIFRGTVPVKKGKFRAKFIVPKDISYGGNLARISAYVWNEETDGAGCKENILVSSTSANLVDVDGPEMKIYFKEHENFSSGDIVNENVTFVVELADTVSGINIAGEIGHSLTLNIDPDEETCLSELNRFQGISQIDLTDLFQFKEGDHFRGTVEFPLNFPQEVDIGGKKVRCMTSDGEDKHRLRVKAWDNSNNSTTASVEVFVVHEEGLVIKKIMNYPNPLKMKTTFTFISNQDAEVQIKIYTISGQLIRTLPWPKEYKFASSGFNMLEWDGLDEDGDHPANGVYLYKLIARAQGESGTIHKEEIGRLAIIR